MLYNDTLRHKFFWLIILKRMIIAKVMQNLQCESIIKLHFTKMWCKMAIIPFNILGYLIPSGGTDNLYSQTLKFMDTDNPMLPLRSISVNIYKFQAIVLRSEVSSQFDELVCWHL